MRTLGLFVAAAAVSVISGCSGKTENVDVNVGKVRATLRRATSCADLEQSLKVDALEKMNKSIDSQIRMIRKHGFSGGYGYATRGESTSAPVPMAAGAADGKSSNDSAGASTFSETNKQVAGVDEADIVKTDGKNIYLLHGQKLEVLTAWPATSLAESSKLDIEGEPTEMFQWGSKIVVYSRVDGTPIYSAANLKPRPNFQDYGMGGGGGSGSGMDIATAPGGPGGYPYGGWMQNPLTKVTVIDVQGTSTSVSRELYFEGGYLSSRRIDAQVRTVLQGAAPGPQLKFSPETPISMKNMASQPVAGSTQESQLKADMIKAYEALRVQNAATIQSSKVTDWIPYSFTKTGAGVSASSLACEDFYLPTKGTTQYGLTYIETFDATDASSKVKTAAIIGQADTVYSNEKTMVLAARGWADPDTLERLYASNASNSDGGFSSGGTAGSTPSVAPAPETSVGTRNIKPMTEPVVGTIEPVSMDSTHLHKFDIGTDATSALYVASGSVPGSAKDQFAIDERNGTVRISTTERRSYIVPQGATVTGNLPRTANHVFTLQEQAGALATVGSVGDLAPNESVMSTRFVGDVAYVVTFLQKDPLFVIDVSQAHAPRVLGQLTIPGFSSYMHPIDDTHLLTIGQDDGLALQIFDVTNPAAPVQSHKFVYTNEYGYSEAQSNHKAFTYFADKQLLAFPFMAYGSSSMKSTLELFKIGVTTGIQRVGGIDHSSFFATTSSVNPGYCSGYYQPSVRRGLFLDNVVYSISYGGVRANDASTLAPLSSFALPQPQLQSYPGCATGNPVGGDGGGQK